MICFKKFRPVLRVGSHHVTDYGNEWLKRGLLAAGTKAECEIRPFLADLVAGIEHFLEHRCSLRVLKVEELAERIRAMLGQVGLDQVAKQLPPIAPPVTLDLEEFAAKHPYELSFFDQVRREADRLAALGVRDLEFRGMQEAVLLLNGKKRWTPACSRSKEELLLFLLDLRQQQSGIPLQSTSVS